MTMNDKQKIGTHFKKENIFLATVSCTKKNIQMGLEQELYKKLLTAGIDIGACEMFDIFYKDGDTYLRFFVEGVEKYAGDDSDGMGALHNIVPVWKYFSEDELFETKLEDGSMAIGYTNQKPLNRYNYEYNFEYRGNVEIPIGG